MSQTSRRRTLRPYQNPRARGTNPRKKGTNPRAKGENKRVNAFLANVIAIASIKEGRQLTDVEIEEYTIATIDFFTTQYFGKQNHE